MLPQVDALFAAASAISSTRDSSCPFTIIESAVQVGLFSIYHLIANIRARKNDLFLFSYIVHELFCDLRGQLIYCVSKHIH